MIQQPSPATRGQAGGEEEGTRLWLPQEPGWGVQRGLPGLTQAAHLLPCSWGRGRGSPSSREGSRGNPSPTLAPSLPSHQLLRKSQQTLSPRPGKMPRSQLPSCSPPAGAAGSLEQGRRGGRGTGGQTLPSPGSPSPAQEIRGYFISQSHVLGMKGRWGTRERAQERKEAINPKPRRRLHRVRDPGLRSRYQRSCCAPSLPVSPWWPPAQARLRIQGSF